MLQKKEYQHTPIKKPIVENQTSGKTKINATKEGPAKQSYQQQQSYKTKLPATPTTIKKPIVENQTSGKTKINATKEGIPATTKLPATPTKN